MRIPAKLSKRVTAVVYDDYDRISKNHGRCFQGYLKGPKKMDEEEQFLSLNQNELTISKETLKKYGLELVIEEGKHLSGVVMTSMKETFDYVDYYDHHFDEEFGLSFFNFNVRMSKADIILVFAMLLKEELGFEMYITDGFGRADKYLIPVDNRRDEFFEIYEGKLADYIKTIINSRKFVYKKDNKIFEYPF